MTDQNDQNDELTRLRDLVAHYEAVEAARYCAAHVAERHVADAIEHLQRDGGLPLDKDGRLDVGELDRRLSALVTKYPTLKAKTAAG